MRTILCVCALLLAATYVAASSGSPGVLDKAATEAHANPLHTARSQDDNQAAALDRAAAATRHAIEADRRAREEGSIHDAHRARAHAQPGAAAFGHRIENMLNGMKHKANLHRLKNKYENQPPLSEQDRATHLAAAQDELDHIMVLPPESPASDSPPMAEVAAHIPHPHMEDHNVLPPIDPDMHMPMYDPSEDSANYVLHPVQLPPSQPYPVGLNFSTMIYPTKQGNVTIYIGVAEYPLGKFHVYPSPREELDMISLAQTRVGSGAQAQVSGGAAAHLHAHMRARLNPLCDGVAPTSVSAQAYNCLLAMNLGFFDMATDSCLGNIVSNDQWINHAADAGMQRHAHFGLTRKGNFITGYLTAEECAAGIDGGFHELTQGNGWLVREGKNYLKEAASIEHMSQAFIDIKAPRNALGHTRDGRLLMFQADGEEDIKLGLTLTEFAAILTSSHFDVWNAINVDGGGSSTTAYKGRVVNRPTCRDTPEICERAVTTISCLMP